MRFQQKLSFYNGTNLIRLFKGYFTRHHSSRSTLSWVWKKAVDVLGINLISRYLVGPLAIFVWPGPLHLAPGRRHLVRDRSPYRHNRMLGEEHGLTSANDPGLRCLQTGPTNQAVVSNSNCLYPYYFIFES